MINNNGGFQLAIQSYREAIPFIFRNRLGWYFIFPVIFNIALFSIGFFSVASFGDDIILYLDQWMNTEGWDFMGSAILATMVKGLIHLILHLLFFIIYAYFGGYIILILMSPVFAILSEQTEKILTGNAFPFSASRFIKDVMRGVILAVRNLFVELMLTILLIILSFVPIVGYLTPLALLLLSAYFYGFSFIDYTLERHKFKAAASVYFIRRNRSMAIGNGLVFSLVLLIPYAGVMLAGFVSVISVVAATLTAGKMTEIKRYS